VRFSNLRLLRDKGVITQAEYDAAVRDTRDTVGARAGEQPTLVVAKWSTSLYGFVRADAMVDSTQSFDEVLGNRAVEYPLRYTSNHARFNFSARASRFGFRVRAPEWHGIRASAQLEMDFFGTQLPIGPTNSGQPFYQNESTTLSAATPRLRHAFFRVETPIVDVVFGQYWAVLGMQPNYQPGSVQILGFPALLYQRTPQLRLSKTFKTDDVSLEIAAAAVRPAQRDSGVPGGQAGIRFAVEKWRAAQTQAAASTSLAPLSLSVSGDLRRLALTELAANPTKSLDLLGGGIAVDAWIPIVPAKDEKRRANSLAVQGEFVYGSGLADQYTQLTGGLQLPENYPANIDPGIASYDGRGGAHPVQWTSVVAGGQYYLPFFDGRFFVSGHYARIWSPNIERTGFVNALSTNTIDQKQFVDWNLLADVTPQVRFGIGGAWVEDRFLADSNGLRLRAESWRGQLTGLFVF
jgi:hypothetical protein